LPKGKREFQLQNTHGHNPQRATSTPQPYQPAVTLPAHVQNPQTQSAPPPRPTTATARAPLAAAQPAFSAPPGVSGGGSNHGDDFVSRISERLGGRAVFKRLLIATLLFFTLFLIIVASKLISDVKNHRANQMVQFQTELVADASTVERALNAEISWINLALSQRGSAQQFVNSVSRSNTIIGAAVINSNGQVLADSNGVGPQLALINDEGIVTPVVTLKSGGTFLAVALVPGTLIGQGQSTRALIRERARVIDGSTEIGLQGPQRFYRVSANRLTSIISGAEKSTIKPLVHDDRKIWFGAAQVSGPYLSIMDIQERRSDPDIWQNILLFGLLFLGAAWLIWAMMNQLLKQIDSSRKQFLALFSMSHRDQLYNLLKRAALNGPFEIEIGAANLPIFLSCRGRPTQRDDKTKIVIGMAMDITEARGAQARMQSAEARLFDALRSMNDSFVIWDQMDRLVPCDTANFTNLQHRG